MERQTAFPGILIESIKVEKPPFDEKGVIQEFMGRGVTMEFDMLQRAADISNKQIHDKIESAEDMIGPLRETYRISYNLKIVAVPAGDSELIQSLQNRSLSSRARAFVRVKNPFEPHVIDVSEPVKDTALSGEKVGDIYNVTATVTK